MKRPLALIVQLATLLVLLGSCGPSTIGPGVDNTGPGGTITETVGIIGVVVDTSGKAVSGVNVELFDSESRISGHITDNHGTYLIPYSATAGQQLSLVATSADSTTALYISQIEAQRLRFFQDTVNNSGFYVIVDNDTLTAKELRSSALMQPGALQGSILLPAEAEPSGPISITLPGTAYMATASESGGPFTLSGIADGRYTLLISSSGFSTARIADVRIYQGETTHIQPVQLSYDTSGAPTIAPKNVQSSYDTLSGAVTLWWDASPLIDVESYVVDIFDENDNYPAQSVTVDVPSFRDIVFKDPQAQGSVTRTYRIKARDNNFDLGPYSEKETIHAPPPSAVIPKFEWTTTPSSFESLRLGDSILVALSISDRGRGIRNLELNQPAVQWDYQGDEHTIRASFSITLTSSEPIELSAAVEDDGGQIWHDSTVLTIEGLRPHNKLQSCAPLNVARRFAAAATLGGSIYVAGGAFDQFDIIAGKSVPLATGSFERYNPTTDRWSQLRDMPTTRCAAQAIGYNKKLYVLGGSTNPLTSGKWSSVVEVYDMATGLWDSVAPMPTLRSGFSVTLIEDTIVVTGGYLGTTNQPALTIDAFCTSTNTWSTRQATLSQGRKHHTSVLHDGILYLIGGLQLNDKFTVSPLGSVEAYNPVTDMAFEVPSLQLPTTIFNAAAASISGTLYLCGGVEQFNATAPLSQLSSFDSSTQQWQPILTLPQGVQGHVAVALNGALYIIGGASRFVDAIEMGQLNTVYRYNP